MKECEYCGGDVADDVMTCPHCSSTSFKNKCPICGRAIEGSLCPHCAAESERRQAQDREAIAKEVAVAEANSGLVWKTALTFFLPFVGGYFLIKDDVKPGFRIFAIIWCALLGATTATMQGDSVAANILGAFMCLAPIAVYLVRSRERLLAEGRPQGKIWFIAFGVLVAFVVVSSIVASSGSGNSSAEDAAGGTPTTKTMTSQVVAESVGSTEGTSNLSNSTGQASHGSANSVGSGSGSAAVKSKSSAVAAGAAGAGAVAAGGATATAAANTARADREKELKEELSAMKLAPSSDYLEYSSKDVDPLSLVKCSNDEAEITTADSVDLSEVGEQKVRYKVSLGGQSVDKIVVFTVRDTKAPQIKLVDANPQIEYGSEFDPLESIKSVSDKVDGSLSYVQDEPAALGDAASFERVYEDGWFTIDGSVDASTPGTYSLIVKAVDKHGNTKTKEMLVTVGEAPHVEEPSEAQEAPQRTYIANLNTHKFHIPGCRDVSRMNEENRWEVTKSYDEMIAMGYSPCGHCLR